MIKKRYKFLFARVAAVSLIILSVTAAVHADDQCVWEGVDRIVAIGDLHGDFNNLFKILIGTGIVDDEGNWIGGDTHLVQLGDIMDRGDESRKILDLLRKLENESRKAGGWVHVLIGNHEEANLLGNALDTAGYVTLKQFLSFLPDDFKRQREREFLAKWAKNGNGHDSKEAALEQYWIEAKEKDQTARMKYLRHFYETHGKWLLEQNVVIKINDTIFVHGGINEEFSKWELKKINQLARREISQLLSGYSLNPKIVYQPDGPLWFRGLANNVESEFAADVDRILNNLGAGHIVVGHTVMKDARMVNLRRFDGKVWAIDTGISSFYKGRLKALIIQSGQFVIWGDER